MSKYLDLMNKVKHFFSQRTHFFHGHFKRTLASLFSRLFSLFVYIKFVALKESKLRVLFVTLALIKDQKAPFTMSDTFLKCIMN